MSKTIQKKQLCECENCGNEAEMTFVCALPDEGENLDTQQQEISEHKVKGTATCSNCGNEADMWIDL